MPTLNKKLFGNSVTADIVRAGGKCWEKLTSTAATTVAADYTTKNVIGTHTSAAACLSGGCGINFPSIILNVTGSSESVTWCGETWDLPSDSGKDKEVCPAFGDFYRQSKTVTTGGTKTFFQHWWNHAGTVGGLRIVRNGGTTFAPHDHSNQVVIAPSITTSAGGANFYAYSFARWNPYGVTGAPTNTTHYTRLGFSWTATNNDTTFAGAAAMDQPVKAEYLIKDELFGSVTEPVHGITFSWSRGSNWPGPKT